MLESLIIFTGILCVINLISLSIGEDGGKKLSRWWRWQKEKISESYSIWRWERMCRKEDRRERRKKKRNENTVIVLPGQVTLEEVIGQTTGGRQNDESEKA